MTVYSRTAEGHRTAYDKNSALPRELKFMLRLIDGLTPLDVYAHHLRAFGDVRNLLRSLELAGLLEQVGKPSHAEPAFSGANVKPAVRAELSSTSAGV
jgi:hypothetical protein